MKSEPKKQSPESVFYDTLKGNNVTLATGAGAMSGKLLWVDRYSIGVFHETAKQEVLIMKNTLITIRLA